MSQNLSSAAVVVGALRVSHSRDIFCLLLITFVNSLDLDQAWHNKPDTTSGMIWTQNIWHPDNVPWSSQSWKKISRQRKMSRNMRFPTMWYARPANLCICAVWSSLEYSVNIKLLTEHNFEFLSLKGGCTGSSESIHFKMPHCWKSHVAAQIMKNFPACKELNFHN